MPSVQRMGMHFQKTREKRDILRTSFSQFVKNDRPQNDRSRNGSAKHLIAYDFRVGCCWAHFNAMPSFLSRAWPWMWAARSGWHIIPPAAAAKQNDLVRSGTFLSQMSTNSDLRPRADGPTSANSGHCRRCWVESRNLRHYRRKHCLKPVWHPSETPPAPAPAPDRRTPEKWQPPDAH